MSISRFAARLEVRAFPGGLKLARARSLASAYINSSIILILPILISDPSPKLRSRISLLLPSAMQIEKFMLITSFFSAQAIGNSTPLRSWVAGPYQTFELTNELHATILIASEFGNGIAYTSSAYCRLFKTLVAKPRTTTLLKLRNVCGTFLLLCVTLDIIAFLGAKSLQMTYSTRHKNDWFSPIRPAHGRTEAHHWCEPL
jgi:hypothetical protein